MSIAGVKISYHGISKNPMVRYFILFLRIFFPFQFCQKITNCAIFFAKIVKRNQHSEGNIQNIETIYNIII